MTIPNRKDAREDVAAKILAEMTTLQHVYAFQPKDLGGQSPICTVISEPVQYDLAVDIERQTFRLMVSFFARYDGAAGSGMDAASAEDALDNLAQSLATVLAANYIAKFTRASEMIDATIDGVGYSIESHFVEVQWW